MTPILTVGVCSLTERIDLFSHIWTKLASQSEGKPVQLVAIIDNRSMTLGSKRNKILGEAMGRYISFVDDDDDITPDYIDTILETIQEFPDVDLITFRSLYVPDGVPDRETIYSSEFTENRNFDDHFERFPNALMVWKRSISEQVLFPDLTFNEDSIFGMNAREYVEHEVRIDRVLYFHRYSSQGSMSNNQDYITTPKISTLICSVTERVDNFLSGLIGSLREILTPEVQVLVYVDNRVQSVGNKRNALVKWANGIYSHYIDDDDTVSPELYRYLIPATGEGSDVITFDAFRYVEGRKDRIVHYDRRFTRDQNFRTEYRRLPNHLMVIRTELVRETGFREINFGEDSDFAQRLRPKLKTQTRLKTPPLYFYFWNPETSLTHS